MFSIFKKKNEPVFYYVGQNPKERIDNFILDFIKPVLDENQFHFKSSDFSFFRHKDTFKQTVHFRRSRYNSLDKVIRFDMIFLLHDEGYNKWHKEFYKVKADNDILFGGSAAHFKNWDNNYMDNVWYDLAAVDNDKLIRIINHNIETVAIPTLDRLSNRQVALHELRLTSFNVCSILFDYCIMLNDKDTAALIIDDFESYLNGKYKDQYTTQRKLYEIRTKTYKNWA